MRSAVLAGTFGVLALHRFAELPATTSLWLAIVLASLLGVIAFRARTSLREIAMYACIALLAFSVTGLRAADRLGARLAPEWEGRELVIEGYVASLPQPFERGVRFMFEVESSTPRDVGLTGRVLLAWYNGASREAFRDTPTIRAGESWRFTVRLKRPHGNANPHGYDYEAWLIEEDVRASGSIVPRAHHVRRVDLAPNPRAWIERARDSLRMRLWRALPYSPYVGVLIALAIGDQRAISSADWTVFNRTGVAHLMSISGLHVTMLAALAAAITAWAWRRSPRAMLWLPAPKAAAIVGLVAALLYTLLAGAGVPAQRTLYMLAVAALAFVLDRAQSASRILAIALAVVLVIDPWAPLSAGFWLSFSAVAILFYAATRAQAEGWVIAWLRAQWTITIGLVPLTLALFQQVSLVSPLANLVAIPLVSFVVTPLAIAAALVPIDLFAWIAHGAIALLMPLLQWAAGLSQAVWQQHAPIPWSVPLALVAVLIVLGPRGVPARYAALPLLLPLVLIPPSVPAFGVARIDVLDVGQGLAIVVRTHRHVVVYDTGPAYGLETDAGSRVVVPFLRGEGIQRIDRLVVTHLDNDHSGGARSIVQTITPAIAQASIALDAPAFEPVFAAAAVRIPCTAGERWEWDGVRFEMLYPYAQDYGAAPRKANNVSCVLRVEAGGRSMLLTGDIEARDEARLLASSAERLRSDVVLVPHHGSTTSSTPTWLDRVGAKVAIVAAGYRNRFGHPRDEVLERYRSRDIEVLRTDQSGMPRIELSDTGITTSSYRADHARYWR
jgi:competence protein ComEC